MKNLYVLTMPEGQLELHETPQNEIVLWTYSDVQKLIDSCGGGQPYVPVTLVEIDAFGDALEKPLLVALDVWHPEGARYPAPDVRELAPLDEIDDTMPDLSVVWIPTRPVRVGDTRVDVELHSATVGEPLLLVYSSLDSLRENCGPHQAASAILADRIDEVASQAGAYGVVFDVELAEPARRTASIKDWTRRNHFG